jgi:multidrug efflux pump subunit AcrA (membrane-fusion protein)
MFKSRIVVAALIAAVAAGCDKPAPLAQQARPVRAITVARHADGETVSLTGHVRAKDEVSLAFRLDGRMIERLVNVGDVVTAGQVVAKLDPQIQQFGLNSAQAELASAQAMLVQARLTFGRQQQLVKDGWTSRANFDEARQKLDTAQGQWAPYLSERQWGTVHEDYSGCGNAWDYPGTPAGTWISLPSAGSG